MTEEAKRELINTCLQRSILVNKDILTKLDTLSDLEGFNRYFKQKLTQNFTLTKDSLISLMDEYAELFKENENSQVITHKQPEIFKDVTPGTVDITFSYEREPKKRTVADFISLFTARYNAIRPMLQNRTEMKNLTAINRLRQKNDRGEISIIALITNKTETHTGKIIFEVEDPSGTTKVMVSPDRDCFEIAKDCVCDEVIGVVGNAGNGIIFSNNIILPDIPLYKELKKSPDEAYAVFLGDFHYGSNVFLYEPFERFVDWINGDCGPKYLEIVKKIKYLFITGDLVEGVGIYPGQENDLHVKDIYEQYDGFAKYLAKLPSHIKIIICPGNHDAMRIAEPQPPLYKDFAKPVWDLPNVVMVSNPAYVNIHKQEGFPGFDVLLYHGFSFIKYADKVESIRSAGGQKRVDLIMEFLLKRRHLAPEHKSTLYLPDADKDSLVIEKIPDIFASGHIHRTSATNYRNVTLLNCSCWLSTTEYQEKIGLKPEPGKVILLNLQTRKAKLLKFYDEDKAKEDKRLAEEAALAEEEKKEVEKKEAKEKAKEKARVALSGDQTELIKTNEQITS